MSSPALSSGPDSPPAPPATTPGPATIAAWLAGSVPFLSAVSWTPSATMVNQILAVGLWGLWLALAAPRADPRASGPALAALWLVALAALATPVFGSLPFSIGFSSGALALAAVALAAAGAGLARQDTARLRTAWLAICTGLLAGGVLSAGVGLLQVHAPQIADGPLLAASSLDGIAVGNLRQPNHLCSVLLLALIALVVRHELAGLPRIALWGLAAVMVWVIELSASRTGAVGLLLGPLWALCDRRLSRPVRQMLFALPLLYLAFFGLAWGWAHLGGGHEAEGAAARMADELGAAAQGSPNSRLNVWRNTLGLIAAQPWSGVGWGEYNLAWTLNGWPDRPTAFFDHAHNLPLQLLAELGIPLGSAVLVLTAMTVLVGWRRCARLGGDRGLIGRSAAMLLLMLMWHSMVEYPLWYAYFLLPAALAAGVALGQSTPADERTLTLPAPVSHIAGVLMVCGGLWALADFHAISSIYAPASGEHRSLQQRIIDGQRSWLFAHHADYAAATNPVPPLSRTLGLQRAVHHLLDGQLMQTWARELAAQGHPEHARLLMQRLGEFRRLEPDKQERVCGREMAPGDAAICVPPTQTPDWRSFIPLTQAATRAVLAAAVPARP
ncbi:MAG: hypothetical protein RLY78_2129 [Pseudomonadota bacterium]